MQPTTHHSNTHQFRAPEGVSEADVATVAATVWQEDGEQIVTTFWSPSPEEMRDIFAGKPVAVSFFGGGCPVHAVAVAK